MSEGKGWGVGLRGSRHPAGSRPKHQQADPPAAFRERSIELSLSSCSLPAQSPRPQRSTPPSPPLHALPDNSGTHYVHFPLFLSTLTVPTPRSLDAERKKCIIHALSIPFLPLTATWTCSLTGPRASTPPPTATPQLNTDYEEKKWVRYEGSPATRPIRGRVT